MPNLFLIFLKINSSVKLFLLAVTLGLTFIIFGSDIAFTSHQDSQFLINTTQLSENSQLTLTSLQSDSSFLYLPFRVVSNTPNYITTMTSIFDHSNPNYTRSDNKIVMFNGGIFDDNCYSVNYYNQPVSNCAGALQSFTDETNEFPRQYYNGHSGYDWAISGDVLAAASGTVAFEGWWPQGNTTCSGYTGLGYMVIIDHQNGYRTLYGHMQNESSPFSEGQTVNVGQKIGTVGNTTGCGTSTGTHLHFQVEHWQWQNENWYVTDPFGWDFSIGLDPLLQFNGESSHNLWINGSPTSYGGNVGEPPSAPTNGQYMGGAYIYDAPPDPNPAPTPTPTPNDNTPPSASGFNPLPSGGIANLSTSGVQDNIGGSGVREVRFSAKVRGEWIGIGADSTYPYSLAWNMCIDEVPDGDVELGMEVWDNSGNKWVWSEHYANPHITKNYNCSGTSYDYGVYLYENTGLSGGVCYVTQDEPSVGSHCGGGWNDNIESVRVVGPYYFAMYLDDGYSPHPPLTGNFTDNLPSNWLNQVSSIRVRRNSPAAFTLYSLGDYNGESWASDRTIYDLGDWNWNDKAESIRVASGYGVLVCPSNDFLGNCGRATGPAEWSDINALAQGLRDAVSSIRVCSGPCPEAGDPPDLIYPETGETLVTGQSTTLRWGGDELNGFYVELWGGALGSTQRFGWTSNVSWNVGVLAASPNPYYWHVKGERGYGETSWASGSFCVTNPDTTPPAGVMTAPNSGGYQGGPTVTLSANASDTGSGVNRLEFYAWLDDHWQFLGTDSSAPYAYTWDISSIREGGVWVSADVVDNAENHSGLIWEPDWSYFVIDKSPPSSSVIPLPATQSNPQFTVRWSGNDNFTQNDLIFYDVQYQLNCAGSWIDWFVMDNWEGATFNGQVGQTYCFRSRAHDLVGNTEAWPSAPDTRTSVTTQSVQAGSVYLPAILNNYTSPNTSSLQNGTFEQGPGIGWQEYSSNGWSLVLDSNSLPVSPHTGDWAVWLGGSIDEISLIKQEALIPSNDPTLRFWYWISSEDYCGYDFGGVLINSNTVVDVFDLCADSNTNGWIQRSVSLSAYSGQTIDLEIRAETDSSLNSNLFIDDVTLGAIVSNNLLNSEPANTIELFIEKSNHILPSFKDDQTVQQNRILTNLQK